MATSGSINFTQTRNEIITTAFQLAGIYGVGRTTSSEDEALANTLLNLMIKSWQEQGLHLWAKEEAFLFIADNTGVYTLSNDSSSAKACSRSDAVITQLDGDHATAATSLTVDTTTGMTTSDIIGVVLDDDTIEWTTISTIPTSTTLTIASGLDSAAADNSYVYTFTSRINKPLRILSMRRVIGIDSTTSSTRTETLMAGVSHDEFFSLSTKTRNGVPTQYYYNPDLSTGTLYLWPRPDDPNYHFEFTYERMLEDFDAATDDADFPSHWLEPMCYQLAFRLAIAFSRNDKMQILGPVASQMLENLLNSDREITMISMMPRMN